MLPLLDERPFGLTSFAIGERYEEELGHLLQSVADVYALETNRPTVMVGRLRGTTMRLMNHHLASAREEEWAVWDIPEAVAGYLSMPDSLYSWWPIVGLKAWWLYKLWGLSQTCPLVWLDADARLHRRLDLPIPSWDFLGAHWIDFEGHEVLHSGTLILQGRGILPVLCETAKRCEAAAGGKPPRGHQEIFQEVILEMDCPVLSLPDSYCSIAAPGTNPSPDAVVAHWQAHRHRIDPDWPPPEEARGLGMAGSHRL